MKSNLLLPFPPPSIDALIRFGAAFRGLGGVCGADVFVFPTTLVTRLTDPVISPVGESVLTRIHAVRGSPDARPLRTASILNMRRQRMVGRRESGSIQRPPSRMFPSFALASLIKVVGVIWLPPGRRTVTLPVTPTPLPMEIHGSDGVGRARFLTGSTVTSKVWRMRVVVPAILS